MTLDSQPVLHRDGRVIYQAALRRCADRLSRLLATTAGSMNPFLLAMFVGQLLRCAVPLCSKELAADLLVWLGRRMREEYGLCPFCGARRQAEALMCPDCIAEVNRVDQELSLHGADPGTPQ